MIAPPTPHKSPQDRHLHFHDVDWPHLCHWPDLQSMSSREACRSKHERTVEMVKRANIKLARDSREESRSSEHLQCLQLCCEFERL